MLVGTPYLRAIELHIKDAFPKSKVCVFCEESPFYQTKCAVKAYVDRYGASSLLTLMKESQKDTFRGD